MEQKQLLLTRADYEQQQRENRIALFGADYVENQERIEQGSAEDAANANALANLKEANQQIEAMLQNVLKIKKIYS